MPVKNNPITEDMVFTVSEYLELLNTALKSFQAKVTGEITELSIYPSGHVYFSIKDQSASVLSCIIWKYQYAICGVKLEKGLEVILSGSPNIYPASGRFSFVATTVALKGEGALKKAYDDLKAKLETEGLFAEERKRPLPAYPRVIGLITSKQGAVIHDFLTNVGRCGFQIKMVDSRVEGQEAISDLLAAVSALKKQRLDILVVMRGGGSLESLQAFNNEALARALANFPCPVVAAIGHDQDVPLLALVADASCSTPTAAAQLVSQTWQSAPIKIGQYEKLIFQQFQKTLFNAQQQVWQIFSGALANLASLLGQSRAWEAKLGQWQQQLQHQLHNLQQRLDFLAQTIQAKDPRKNLALGYCIARKNGAVIKTVQGLQTGDNLDLQLADGIISSVIARPPQAAAAISVVEIASLRSQ